MNIKDVVKEYEKGSKIKFTAASSIKNKCPHCKEDIIITTLNDEGLNYQLWPNFSERAFVYEDGDNIFDVEKGINLERNQYDAHMLQGQCINCKNQYVGIDIDILNKSVDEPEYDFYINDDSILYAKDVTHELFLISISEKEIGKLTIFKNVNYNNSIYDIYRIELGALGLKVDLKGVYGVSSSHIEEEQYDIWKDARVLSQLIINDFTNYFKI